jgi:hypothetical protein
MTASEARAKLDELLKAFGTATGAAGLATEESGVCILVFDKRTWINLLADTATDHLVVWSTLGALPAQGAETTLRALMRANLFWNGTRGATLGLMPESDNVVLAIRRPMDETDVEVLRDLIELMVEQAEAFTAMLAGEASPVQGSIEHASIDLASAIRG